MPEGDCSYDGATPTDGVLAGADAGVERVERGSRRARTDVDAGSVGVVTRIWRLARYLESHRRSQLVQHGTERATLEVLESLRESGPPYRRSVSELTRSSLITPGGVSQRLRKLERAGLVTRHVHTGDRRRVDVELTPEGLRLTDSAVTDVLAYERRLLARLSEQEQRDLGRLLGKLLAGLEPPYPV
jgi:DNA-binding MarR family transcriptional regulator